MIKAIRRIVGGFGGFMLMLMVGQASALPGYNYIKTVEDAGLIVEVVDDQVSGTPKVMPIGVNDDGLVLVSGLDDQGLYYSIYDIDAEVFLVERLAAVTFDAGSLENSPLIGHFFLDATVPFIDNRFLLPLPVDAEETGYAYQLCELNFHEEVFQDLTCNTVGDVFSDFQSIFEMGVGNIFQMNREGWILSFQVFNPVNTIAGLSAMSPSGVEYALDMNGMQGGDIRHSNVPYISEGDQPRVALAYTGSDSPMGGNGVRLYSYSEGSWSYQDFALSDKQGVSGLINEKMILQGFNGPSDLSLYLCDYSDGSCLYNEILVEALGNHPEGIIYNNPAVLNNVNETKTFLYGWLTHDVGNPSQAYLKNFEISSLMGESLRISDLLVEHVGSVGPLIFPVISAQRERLLIADSAGLVHYFSTEQSQSVNNIYINYDADYVDTYSQSQVTLTVNLQSETVHGIEVVCNVDGEAMNLTGGSLWGFPDPANSLVISPLIEGNRWIVSQAISGTNEPFLGQADIGEIIYTVANVTGQEEVTCNAKASNSVGGVEPVQVNTTILNLDNGITGGDSTVSGVVERMDGSAAENVVVTISVNGRSLSSVTNGDGEYYFAGLRNGYYTLSYSFENKITECVSLEVGPLSENEIHEVVIYPGDINGDGVIDIADYTVMAAAYRSVFGDSRYVENADINNDGVIDIYDLSILGSHFGRASCVSGEMEN